MLKSLKTMNIVDDTIALYARNINDRLSHLNSISRRAALVDIHTQATGLLRVLNFCLGREYEGSLQLEIEPIDNEPFMNGSLSDQLSVQKGEITDQGDIIRSLSVHQEPNSSCLACGNSLKSKRKGAKFCSDICKNKSRQL